MERNYGKELLDRLTQRDKEWYSNVFGYEVAEQLFEDFKMARNHDEVSKAISIASSRDTRLEDLDPETSRVMTPFPGIHDHLRH